MPKEEIIELIAGSDANGVPVVEKLPMELKDQGEHRLIQSPAFVRGLARGDVIKVDKDKGSFELIRRSGNLCIRVIAREDLETLEADLSPLIEKLGGQLDFGNDRILVYSIHVSCGFQPIEQVLNDHVGDETESMWMYGNVYDPADGVTPLNWWKAILSEK